MRKAYESLDIVFFPSFEQPSYYTKLIELTIVKMVATRNILEHNRGIVDKAYLLTTNDSSFQLGDRVSLTLSDLAEAIWAVDIVATLLNCQVVEKFPEMHVNAKDVLVWLDMKIDPKDFVVSPNPCNE